MTKLIPGQEEGFLKKRFEKVEVEYCKMRIDINDFDHQLTPDEIKEINLFNKRLLEELGG